MFIEVLLADGEGYAAAWLASLFVASLFLTIALAFLFRWFGEDPSQRSGVTGGVLAILAVAALWLLGFLWCGQCVLPGR